MPGSKQASLKKIAFVAMPFRNKQTGLQPGQGPESVDFDALWEQAVKPALIAIDYIPLRADEQTGSVIIKDMLEALVFADLVLADISIANGNVYYEAGIRHAARESGCILINADWARPLFDLKQITQVRYPLNSTSPSVADYKEIQSVLVNAIPKFANSNGPVYELVNAIDEPDAAKSQLRESSSVLYAFNTELSAARLKAESGDKALLRGMCSSKYLRQLPGFAVKELIDAVRENLNWSRLVSVVDSLPESIRLDAHFQEQKALGLSMGGKLPEAVAILQQVIARDGKSCVRLGNLGGMYRHLAAGTNKKDQIRYMQSAIEAFENGMYLDLNDYYCSHKLLIMLARRNRSSDSTKATKVSTMLQASCHRAKNADVRDEWLYPTLLIHAFYARDTTRAREYADYVLGMPWSNWKLMGLLSDLLSLLAIDIDSDLDELPQDENADESITELLELCREIRSVLPVSQEMLMSLVIPMLEHDDNIYIKQGSVNARLAKTGEEVVSITSAGEETVIYAESGDVVVQNNTQAQELYVVKHEVFEKRYECLTSLTSQFLPYKASGQSLAVQIDHELTSRLGVGASFFINPSWKSEQFAAEGDYFVCPLPEKKEIYRVGKPEFESTYLKYVELADAVD